MADLLAADCLTACDAVLARVWLLGPGDLCASCSMAPECPDRTRCLHLVASAGLTMRTDGPFRRFPIGARRVGRVAATNAPFVARDDLPAAGVAEPAWLINHGVRSFVAVSLEQAGRCWGVLAIFSRRVLGDEEVELLGVAARAAARGLAAPEAEAAMAAGVTPEARGAGAARHHHAAHAGQNRPDARTLAEVQREHIERVLAQTRGRISGPRGAATVLGLKPSTLVSRMQRLGVRRPPR